MRIIVEKNMSNGIQLAIVDHSRPVAADRWFVKVIATIRQPVCASDQAEEVSLDPVVDLQVRERLGEFVEHQLARERNFVDAAKKDELIEILAEQLHEIVVRYLADATFPARLFAMKYREMHDLCLLERASRVPAEEDENEPADFSHCFK